VLFRSGRLKPLRLFSTLLAIALIDPIVAKIPSGLNLVAISNILRKEEATALGILGM
jgi:hypothetical protein